MTDFIFKNRPNGELEFIGDFEGLYRSDSDPWDQSGNGYDPMMSEFYRQSRKILCNRLTDIHNRKIGEIEQLSICEIGSGTGFLTNMLRLSLPTAIVNGVDISETATTRSRSRFPDIDFFCLDILAEKLHRKYDIIILSNILWYVIHDLQNLISNVIGSLKMESRSSYLVIQNALFKNGQSYGADLVSTIGSMADVFIAHMSGKAEIVSAISELHRSAAMQHDFGLVTIELRRM